MSFWGTTGCLIKGSGLRTAIENVYPPIAVGNMFSGKALTRAVRGHMI